jgi:RNA polymerase sigma-70 factor (ECF subfamily)
LEAADELVRDVFDTAWHQRDRLESDWWLRAWLYRIATTACLDALGTSTRRASSPSAVAAAPTGEAIDMPLVAALQLLPPRQRAALILRDVLGWSMRETAGLLDTTIVAANSALQRARAAMQEHPPAGLE